MKDVAKNFFMYLSQNKLLNAGAKRWGLRLGAQSVVAGTNIEEMIESIKQLNAHGISCTIDNLGEFVYEKEEATSAKEQILDEIGRASCRERRQSAQLTEAREEEVRLETIRKNRRHCE